MKCNDLLSCSHKPPETGGCIMVGIARYGGT